MRGHFGVFLIDGNEIGYCLNWTVEKDFVHAAGFLFIEYSDKFNVDLYEKIDDQVKKKAGYKNVTLNCTHKIIPGAWSKGNVTLEV
jgi:hypothetical protein